MERRNVVASMEKPTLPKGVFEAPSLVWRNKKQDRDIREGGIFEPNRAQATRFRLKS